MDEMNWGFAEESKLFLKLLKHTCDQAPFGVIWHYRNGIIFYANRYILEKLEYSLEEIKGNYLYQFVLLDTRESSESYHVDQPEIGEINMLFSKTGKSFQVCVYSVELNEDDMVCSFLLDMSDKLKMGQEIKRLKVTLNRLIPDQENDSQDHDLFSEFEISNDIVGQSSALRKILKMIFQVAKTPTSVLLLGETGTGKELFAQTIHRLSSRADKALVTLNCAVLPVNLIEDELFGHEKGAFTGASSLKLGRFEIADRGTLFLDEIGELSSELQTKLLRVLQEGEFERLGGTKTINVDVRIIAATNRDLDKLVREGIFRQDLFFRLNSFPITIPSLRERKEDIPELVEFFVKEFCSDLNRKPKKVSVSIIKKLMEYDWPGNVRELQNIVERLCITSVGEELELGDFIIRNKQIKTINDDFLTYEENNRQYILSVLKKTEWRVFGEHGAAKLMKINPRTLASKMRKLGISKPH